MTTNKTAKFILSWKYMRTPLICKLLLAAFYVAFVKFLFPRICNLSIKCLNKFAHTSFNAFKICLKMKSIGKQID